MRTVVGTTNAIDKDLRVTDNGDGTLTILVLSTGNSVIYNSAGKAIGRNPGQVSPPAPGAREVLGCS